MKKYLFAIMACALFAVSCVREIREPEQMTETVLSLTAAMEQSAATRTVIDDHFYGDVLWEPGDEIKVFAGAASARFTTDLSDVAATATFRGPLGDMWTEGSPLWAVYPYSDEAVLEGEALTAVLPAIQTAGNDSFAQGVNLSVARTSTASLQFFNVGGGICFSLIEAGISKVVFEGLNGEVLAGKARLAFQEGRPVVQEVIDGSTTITLVAPEGETLGEYTYFIVAFPCTLEKGFKMSFYKGDAVAQKTFAKAVTVKRSIYGGVWDADEGVNYLPYTDENIQFKDAKVKEIVVRYFDTGKDGGLSYKEAAAVRSFLVDEAQTRSDGGLVSVFAGTGITTFPEIVYFTGLTKIEDGVFAGCTSLTSITIPSFIMEIGANAFAGCTGLQSITLESATPPTIGEGAFSDTNNCQIIVPAGMKEAYIAAWGEYAPRIEAAQPDNEIWYTSTDGQAVTPDRTYVFGSSMRSNEYTNGKGVISFYGPVTQVGDYAFWGCENLASIQIPKSVTLLGEWAFMLCKNLTNIQIPTSVTRICDCALQGCQSLVNLQIPESVTQIGEDAFNGCTSLERIAIPASVTQIGTEAFGQVWSCTSIVVDPDNPNYDSRGQCNAIIHTASNTLIAGCKKTTIPSSVEILGRACFFGCRGLVNLDIPSSVTQIATDAFQSCTDLTVISIPPSVTLIGTRAFRRCSSLSSITIPASVTKIDGRAFSECSALVAMTLLGEIPPQLGSDVLSYSNKCIIYVPSGSVETYKAASGWSAYADRIQAIAP